MRLRGSSLSPRKMTGTSAVAGSVHNKRHSCTPEMLGIHRSAITARGGDESASSVPLTGSGAASTA